MVHIKQMKDGRLAYDDNNIYHRKSGKGKWKVKKRSNKVDGSPSSWWEREAYNKKSIYTKLTADLKDSAVTIVDANGGQVFTTHKGYNVHAQTKHKEYYTIDLKKLQEDHPSIYNKYKTKEVHSITLE